MKNHVSNHKLPNLSLIVFLVSISITGSGIMLSSPVTSSYGESSSSGYSSKTLSGTHIVSIIGINKDKSFDPNPIEINAGDSVTWTNDDDDIHTVTSGCSEGPTIGRDFDSGTLASGESFTHKFDNPGTFEYFCSFHESMTGKVVVK
jgi:aldose sugar dehydrogenase